MKEHQVQPGDEKNFETLKKAVKAGRVALMRCRRANAPHEYVTVLCMVNTHEDGSCDFVPVGELCGGNPYEAYLPPDADKEVA